MLLVLLLGIADFGRVFSAGITMEAAARNAAEVAAQEYVQLKRNSSASLDADDYQHLHNVAIDAACSEAKVLENFAESGGTCSMPVVAVCVHDIPAPAADPLPPPGDASCGIEALSAPSECGAMSDDISDPSDDGAWTNNKTDGSTLLDESLPYVEVRVCYQFTTLFNINDLQLPLGWSLSLGETWLERERSFVAGLY
jgi:TadE-like protein